MRFLVLIFSFYLLAISVLPCSDAHNDCNNSKSKTELVQTHDHEKDANDFCSPFCNCNCCSTVAVFSHNNSYQKTSIPDLINSEKFPSFDFLFVSNYNGNIWQPPRILG